MNWFYCTFWDYESVFLKQLHVVFLSSVRQLRVLHGVLLLIAFVERNLGWLGILMSFVFSRRSERFVWVRERNTWCNCEALPKKNLCLVWIGMCHSTTVPECGRESSLTSFTNTFLSERGRFVCIVRNSAAWIHVKSAIITSRCIFTVCTLWNIILYNCHGRAIPIKFCRMSLIFHPNDFCDRAYGGMITVDNYIILQTAWLVRVFNP